MDSRDKELYNMFVNSFTKGAGMKILENLTTKSGHDTWVEIKKLYGYSSVSRTIIDNYQTKLEKLCLDDDMKESRYANSFIIYSKNLEEKNEGYTVIESVLVF